ILGGVLRADPNGLAVLVDDTHPAAGTLLRKRWAEQLADVAERIRLLPRLTPEQYFHLIASADVMLDTLHFGGSNTADDAFAAGVPVVTLPGALPRGCYTAAMYRTIGIDDCIAGSIPDYIERAVRLGTDRAYREQLSKRIASAAAPLYEHDAAVGQLEHFFAK